MPRLRGAGRGPDHAKRFYANVVLQGTPRGRGRAGRRSRPSRLRPDGLGVAARRRGRSGAVAAAEAAEAAAAALGTTRMRRTAVLPWAGRSRTGPARSRKVTCTGGPGEAAGCGAPEVEVVRRGLAQEVAGRRVTSVVVIGARTVRRQPVEELVERLRGATLARPAAIGKSWSYRSTTGPRRWSSTSGFGPTLLTSPSGRRQAHPCVLGLSERAGAALRRSPDHSASCSWPGPRGGAGPPGPDRCRPLVGGRSGPGSAAERPPETAPHGPALVAGIGNIYSDEPCSRPGSASTARRGRCPAPRSAAYTGRCGRRCGSGRPTGFVAARRPVRRPVRRPWRLLVRHRASTVGRERPAPAAGAPSGGFRSADDRRSCARVPVVSSTIRRRVVISGRVQAWDFRWSCRRVAEGQVWPVVSQPARRAGRGLFRGRSGGGGAGVGVVPARAAVGHRDLRLTSPSRCLTESGDSHSADLLGGHPRTPGEGPRLYGPGPLGWSGDVPQASDRKGFKSFADRTTLDFEPGVAVVVGPNGSGKSNVVDAVAGCWAPRAPAPCGAGIWRTSSSRHPEAARGRGRRRCRSRSTNSARIIPVPSREVTITRSLTRDGESGYAINGEPCRSSTSPSCCPTREWADPARHRGPGSPRRHPPGRRRTGGPSSRRRPGSSSTASARRRPSGAWRRRRSPRTARRPRQEVRPHPQAAGASSRRPARHGGLSEELRAIRLHLAGREITTLTERLASLGDKRNGSGPRRPCPGAGRHPGIASVAESEAALSDLRRLPRRRRGDGRIAPGPGRGLGAP